MESVKRLHLILLTVLVLVPCFSDGNLRAQANQAALGKSLSDVYLYWRKAMVEKNFAAWNAITASHQKIAVQNRVMSEKGKWPQDVFRVPTAPPSLQGLKLLRTRSKGVTAKLVFFGKVDFGVGGKPTENLLVISFVHEGRGWKYDAAEFVNLSNLKEVRKQLLAGDLSYVDGQAFLPDGKRPVKPIVVKRAKYIAKVYSYCPGREVKVSVNGLSQHRFQDTQRAETIIGGARDGNNSLWFSIKDLPGYTGKDPLTVRVYLFSQIEGVKPVKVYEYLVKEGQEPKLSLSTNFAVDAASGRKILTGR